MKNLLKEEFIKFWFGLFATAIGVFIALKVNNWNTESNDDERFKNILKAIHAESDANIAILNESFVYYVNNDTVDIKNEFTYKISEEFLNSEVFLKRATNEQVKTLSYYILNLKKANTFKVIDHGYKVERRYYKMDSELQRFREAFNSTLDIARKKIIAVGEMKFKEDNDR